MNSERIQATHYSDEDLIELLYCEDKQNPHVANCQPCQNRLQALRDNRDWLEQNQLATEDESPERLALQRRQIYARLSQPVPFWYGLRGPKWVSAAAATLLLSGSLFLYQHGQSASQTDDKISDAELAQEVSRLSQTVEPVPAEPLKGLFE